MQWTLLRRLRGQAVGFADVFRLDGRGFAVAKWSLAFDMARDLVITPPYWALRNSLSPAGKPETLWFFWTWLVLVSLLTVVIGAPFMFTPLGIVDARLAPMRAVEASWKAARPILPALIAATIVVNLLAGSGLLVCGVGFLVSGGALYAFAVLLFRRLFVRWEQVPTSEG